MRSIEEIQETGAAWVTEVELAMLCAFAKRAEIAEIGLKATADHRARVEAAHHDAAVQWQDEARLRREAEAKLAEAEERFARTRCANCVSLEAKLAEARGESSVLVGCPCRCHTSFWDDPHLDCRECVRGTWIMAAAGRGSWLRR